MVLNEVWYLVDDDRNSVPGISFMSFTETNLNEQRDDVENSLPNADTIAEWKVSMPSHRQVNSGDSFEIEYSIRKNGIEITDINPTITATGNITMVGNMVTVGESGQGILTVSYMG
jgi:hypothetical protein